MSQPKLPDVNSIPEHGNIYFASAQEIVMIGMKEGGLSIAPPIWIKMHYLQAFALFSDFISQCSKQQLNEMATMLAQLKNKM